MTNLKEVTPALTSAMPLPKWQSHKVVSADKIVGTQQGSTITKDDTGVRWTLEGGRVIAPSHDLLRRAGDRRPAKGDYYVEYDDGYQSWSPAKAFEEGYTRLKD